MRRETLTAIVGVAVLALGISGYIAADIADRVPGFLTTAEVPSPADPPELPTDSGQSLATFSTPEGEPVLSSDVAQLWGSVAQSAEEGQWTAWGNVIDARSGEVLLDASANQGHTPASTTKVLTAFAALKTLDPARTLSTSLHASGSELFLTSEGDFLLGAGASDPDDVNGRAGLADLADEAAAALVNAGTTNVTLNWADSPFDGPDRLEAWTAQDVQGYAGAVGAMAIDTGRTAPSVYAFVDDPEATVAAVFAQRLQERGIAVALGGASSGLEGAETIATIQSAPLGEQIRWMLYNSDNTLAEQLGRLSARARGVETSFPGAVSVIRQTLEESGVPTSGLSLGDCSGLSSDDRIAPQTLVGAINVSLASTGPLADLPRSLPWAGLNGTMERRMTGGGAYANAQAKTGTLGAVSSLAGIVQTSTGRILVYAIGSENVPDDGGALTRPVLDAFVTGLAGL